MFNNRVFFLSYRRSSPTTTIKVKQSLTIYDNKQGLLSLIFLKVVYVKRKVVIPCEMTEPSAETSADNKVIC